MKRRVDKFSLRYVFPLWINIRQRNLRQLLINTALILFILCRLFSYSNLHLVCSICYFINDIIRISKINSKISLENVAARIFYFYSMLHLKSEVNIHSVSRKYFNAVFMYLVCVCVCLCVCVYYIVCVILNTLKFH